MRAEMVCPGVAAPLQFSRRRRPNAAADSAHGGEDSGARAASRHAALDEEVEDATTEVVVFADFSGEACSGGGDPRVAREGERGRIC